MPKIKFIHHFVLRYSLFKNLELDSLTAFWLITQKSDFSSYGIYAVTKLII